MKKVLLLAFYVCYSVVCFGQKWIEIERTEGDIIELDVTSIKRNESKVYFWTKWTKYVISNKNEVENKLEENRSVIADINYGYFDLYYYMFDCELDKYQVLSVINYTSEGKVIDSNNYKEDVDEYDSVVPGSIASSIKDEICKKQTNVKCIKDLVFSLPRNWSVNNGGNGKVYSMQCESPDKKDLLVILVVPGNGNEKDLLKNTIEMVFNPDNKLNYTDIAADFIGKNIFYSTTGHLRGIGVEKVVVKNFNSHSYIVSIKSLDERTRNLILESILFAE